MKISLKEEDRS